jgi:hypothetical protein
MPLSARNKARNEDGNEEDNDGGYNPANDHHRICASPEGDNRYNLML